MNPIEEKLWSYIDGSCTEDERTAISRLIASDEVYRLKYQELLAFEQELSAMDLDEPSMGFTYKVMESIRTEHAQQPLKAAIDKRIIIGIATFFILTISGLIIYALIHTNLSAGISDVGLQSKEKSITQLLSGPIGKGFLFFDVVLALFLFDSYLRKNHLGKQA